MITQFRLNSVVPNGVGSSSESAAIDLIYEHLLQEFGQNIYSFININQVGNDLNEFVMREPGNKIHVNIRYPNYEYFENKSIDEKNRIRLDVIHTALLRIAEYDNKLDVNRLEEIREKILDKNFCFDFVYRIHQSAKNANQIGKVIIRPLINKFVIYVVIEIDGKEKCRQIIFNGLPTYYYMEKFFCFGKWKGDNDLIIWGKEKIVQTCISVGSCSVNMINLTPYPKPPYYTLMNTDSTKEEKEQADKDWQHSLPPNISAITRQADN